MQNINPGRRTVAFASHHEPEFGREAARRFVSPSSMYAVGPGSGASVAQ